MSASYAAVVKSGKAPSGEDTQPLIASTHPNYNGEPEEQPDEENLRKPLVELADNAPKKRSPWKMAFYAALTLIGVALVALFIKGFLDADDVEVGGLPSARPADSHDVIGR